MFTAATLEARKALRDLAYEAEACSNSDGKTNERYVTIRKALDRLDTLTKESKTEAVILKRADAPHIEKMAESFTVTRGLNKNEDAAVSEIFVPRALFTHPVTPEGGALVPPREPSQTMMDMGLYHSSADSSWADIHTVWTSMWDVAFRDGDLAQPDLSASGGAQGLEWNRNHLYFKNKEIGSYHIWPGSVAITFMGGAGARQFEFVDEAKAALELEARTWLSPLSQASGVQREYDLAMKEASDLAMFIWKKFYADDAPNFGLCDTAAGILSQIDNMVTGLVKAPLSQASDTVAVSRERLEECFALEDTLRKEHVPDSLLREISSLRDRLRASMGGK